MAYKAAVITVSDKCSRGERVDTSGPAVCAILREKGYSVEYSSVIPDDIDTIKAELISCADEKGISLVLTTGGTGFSPRDVTPEATLAVVERETRGIPEAMRAESLRITPKGCLSRSAAGIRGKTLIVNLPGSEKAAKENLLAVIDALDHGLEMLLGSGSADCGEPHHHHHHHHEGEKTKGISLDEWIREAKGDERVGMYLIHNGVVRGTAKAAVRGGDESAPAVKGMRFSCDRKKLARAELRALTSPGIYTVRTWVNEGELKVGDDLMYVLIGGDIRDHVVAALQELVSRIKSDCVTEEEIF